MLGKVKIESTQVQDILKQVHPGTELVLGIEDERVRGFLYKDLEKSPIPTVYSLKQENQFDPELVAQQIPSLEKEYNLTALPLNDFIGVDPLERPETLTALSEELSTPRIIFYRKEAPEYPSRTHTITGTGSPLDTLEQLLRRNIEIGGINIIFLTIDELSQYQYPLLGKFSSFEKYDPELVFEMIMARKDRLQGTREPLRFYVNPGPIPKLYPPRDEEDTMYALQFHRIIEAHDYSWFGMNTGELIDRLVQTLISSNIQQDRIHLINFDGFVITDEEKNIIGYDYSKLFAEIEALANQKHIERSEILILAKSSWMTRDIFMQFESKRLGSDFSKDKAIADYQQMRADLNTVTKAFIENAICIEVNGI